MTTTGFNESESEAKEGMKGTGMITLYKPTDTSFLP